MGGYWGGEGRSWLRALPSGRQRFSTGRPPVMLSERIPSYEYDSVVSSTCSSRRPDATALRRAMPSSPLGLRLADASASSSAGMIAQSSRRARQSASVAYCGDGILPSTNCGGLLRIWGAVWKKRKSQKRR